MPYLSTEINIRRGLTGRIGETTIPYLFRSAIMPNGLIRMLNGTGATQVNCGIVVPWTIATTANLDIDVTTGQLDINRAAVNLSAIKLVYLEITNPGVNDSVRFGPQGVTNAAQLWFQAATTNFYDVVRSKLLQTFENGAGWTVDGSNKILRIHNPSAGSLSGWLVVAGIGS